MSAGVSWWMGLVSAGNPRSKLYAIDCVFGNGLGARLVVGRRFGSSSQSVPSLPVSCVVLPGSHAQTHALPIRHRDKGGTATYVRSEHG